VIAECPMAKSSVPVIGHPGCAVARAAKLLIAGGQRVNNPAAATLDRGTCMAVTGETLGYGIGMTENAATRPAPACGRDAVGGSIGAADPANGGQG
jgi:hypothetical protein